MRDARPVLPNVIVAVLFLRNGGGLRVFQQFKSLIERCLNWQNRWPTGLFSVAHDLFPPEVKTGLPELTPAAPLPLRPRSFYSTFLKSCAGDISGKTRAIGDPLRNCLLPALCHSASSLQSRQRPSGRRWMPCATTRCQDAPLVQLSGNSAHAGEPLGPQVIYMAAGDWRNG